MFLEHFNVRCSSRALYVMPFHPQATISPWNEFPTRTGEFNTNNDLVSTAFGHYLLPSNKRAVQRSCLSCRGRQKDAAASSRRRADIHISVNVVSLLLMPTHRDRKILIVAPVTSARARDNGRTTGVKTSFHVCI
jgi:hypothetical protein